MTAFFNDYLKDVIEETASPADGASAHLEIRNGPEDGRVFPILTETVRIGRQLPEPERASGPDTISNFIVRSDKAISREHCELTALSSDTFLLKDLGSRFGTELNGARIAAPAPCRHGDTITIGDTTLMLRTEDDTATV